MNGTRLVEEWLNQNWTSGMLAIAVVFFLTTVVIGLAPTGRSAWFALATQGAVLSVVALVAMLLYSLTFFRSLDVLPSIVFGIYVFAVILVIGSLRTVIFFWSTVLYGLIARELRPWRWHTWVIAAPVILVLIHAARVCHQHAFAWPPGYAPLSALVLLPSLALICMIGVVRDRLSA